MNTIGRNGAWSWPRATDVPPVLATVVLVSFVTLVAMRLSHVATQPPPGAALETIPLKASPPLDERADADLVKRPLAPAITLGADQSHRLAARKLLIPVDGVAREQLRDHFEDKRGPTRRHEAIDIMARSGTRILAVADGKVAKLFYSAGGGITVYQTDPEGQFIYYYAHLEKYGEGLAEGQELKRGQLVGYVGSTGNATTPHLHFAIFQVAPGKRWWKGRAVNPYPYLTERS